MIINYRGSKKFITDPNICPHCHVINTPHHSWGISSSDTDDIDCFISAWQCSNLECGKIFIAQYKIIGSEFQFNRFFNGLPKGPNWPVPILELKSSKIDSVGGQLKSNFIKTYLQSLEAENSGLDELAGMGYRKSIEYLVKDWAIQTNPAKKEDIESKWLGAVISTYYEGDLKEILERATWLGNDQAHYNKLFEEYELDVLKELINLILAELDRDYKKAHYIQLIQKRK